MDVSIHPRRESREEKIPGNKEPEKQQDSYRSDGPALLSSGELVRGFHHVRLFLCGSGTTAGSSELIKRLAIDVRQAGGVGARAVATGSNRMKRPERIRGRPNVLSSRMGSTIHRLEVSLALS